MKTHTTRVHDARRTLERCLMHYGLRQMNGDTDLVKAGEKVITTIEAAVAEFERLSMPKAPDRYPSKLERIVSLANGLEAVARARGAAALPADSLHRLVVAALGGDERGFWAKEQPQAIAGFIKSEPELSDELKARGILVWLFEHDLQIRLVDTQWLQTHADIYDHILSEPEPGARCRFCRLHETDGSALTDFKLQIGDRINTNARVHAACCQTFGTWVVIAKSYPNIEAAVAADIEAGRAQGAAPALPAVPTPVAGPGPAFCAKENQ